jgi:hypothetical protein
LPLCHGLTGNAEILLSAARVLGDDFVEGNDLARAAEEALQATSSSPKLRLFLAVI